MDSRAFFKLSYGLYILSTVCDGKQNGCVVNTVTQVTSDPAKLSVAVNKKNLTAELIARSGVFNAVALAEDASMQFIGHFGFQCGRDIEKYKDFPCDVDANGVNYPSEFATALFSCKVESKLDLGSHMLFIGEVTDARVLADNPVMTYAYYHAVKKGKTPPNAPSYKAPEQHGWRCKVCGYVHAVEQLPADFICPVCGRDASFFEKI